MKRFLRHEDSRDEPCIKLKSPTGIFVDRKRLYVVEMLSNQVKVLALIE